MHQISKQSRMAQSYYGGRADVYDSAIIRAGYRAPRIAFEMAAEFMDLRKKTTRMLDLGCGTGAVAAIFKKARPDMNVHAGDIAVPMLVHAQKKHSDVHYTAMDIAGKFPFASRSFDLVTMFCVLGHMENPVHVFKEAARITRRGGVFIGDAMFQGESFIGNNKTPAAYVHHPKILAHAWREAGWEYKVIRQESLYDAVITDNRGNSFQVETAAFALQRI